MKNFRNWTDDLARCMGDVEKPDTDSRPDIHQDLLDYNDDGDGETFYYRCCKCGEDFEIEEPELFDPDYNYCGRSQWCIP